MILNYCKIVDFFVALSLSPDYSCRLLIVFGKFLKITISMFDVSIYDVVADDAIVVIKNKYNKTLKHNRLNIISLMKILFECLIY